MAAAFDDTGDWENVGGQGVEPPSGIPVRTAAAPESAQPTPAPAPPAAAGTDQWEDVKPPQPQAADTDQWTDVPAWPGYLSTAASGLAQGAIKTTGASIAGLPELTADYGKNLIATLDRIDAGEKVPMKDDPIGYQDMPPDLRKQIRADVEKQIKDYDPKQTALYKTGTAIEQAAERIAPMSPEQQQSITGQASTSIGAMVPAVIAGAAAGPEAGTAIAATQFGLAGAHEQAEAARAKGATPEEVAEAARAGAIVNTAMGVLPIHTVLAPIERTAPGIANWAATRLKQATQAGLTFAGIGEAQEWVSQEIAKNFYDPNAGYTPDAKRAIGSFLGGFFMGGVFTPTPYHGPEQTVAQPAAAPQPHAENIKSILGEPPGTPPPGGPGAPVPETVLPDETAPGRMREAHYVTQAIDNLGATSRTVQGILDTSSTPGKADRLVEGLTPEQAAATAVQNYGSVIGDLYAAAKGGTLPTNGPDMERFVDGVAARVNDGILKPDALMRGADTRLPNQTRAADIPAAHAQFSQELVDRLNDPNADPVETAAWIEWRLNMMDHQWSDGVGKVSKALAAIPLMRAGLPLPTYPPNSRYYEFPKGAPRGDPRDGASYLGPAWQRFNDYYHLMASPRVTLQSMLDNRSPLAAINDHPLVLNAVAEARARIPTGTPDDFADPQWRAARVYQFGGEQVAGWDNAVDRLTRQAESFSGSESADVGHRAVIVTGPSASGKSFISGPLAHEYRAAVVDSDEAKKIIPEYQGGVGSGAAHEESSYLAKDVLKNLIRAGKNVVMPKVGADAQNLRRTIEALKGLGYTVDLVHAAATPEISGRRNIARFLRTGRIVDPDYIATTGDNPRRAAYLLRGDVNDFADVDTSKGHPARVEGDGAVAEFLRARENIGQRPAEGAAGAPRGESRPQGLIGAAVPNFPAHRVAAADGTAVEVQPVVVDAGDVITSQDHGYDTTLQPRQRDRAAAQAQVRSIATNLDPTRLGYSAEADRGAPIVGPDGMVESGNGRVLALRQVYDHGGARADAYRAWLAGQGVDVSAYRRPILVRQRTIPLSQDERRAFTVAANQAATLAMSAPERAIADARHVSSGMLSLIRNPDDLAAAANRGFFRAFIAELPQSEQGAMADAKGQLSAEGLTRIRNAVLAKAYDDTGLLTRISESTNDDVRSISNAMVAAAPMWARLRGEVEVGRVRPDIDVTPHLVDAVRRTADIRNSGARLEDYLNQQDAFERMPDATEGFMRMFYDPKGRRAAGTQRITDALRFYAQEAEKVTTEKGLDLGLVPVEPRDILRGAREAEWEDVSDRAGIGDVEGSEAAGRQARGPGAGESREAASRLGGPGGPGRTAEGRTAPDEAVEFAQVPTREELDALRHGGPQQPTYEDLRRQNEPVVERGAEGKPQLVIPGAERISAAELARRRAAEPLRPKVAQQPAGDLFAGLEQQGDIEQAIRQARPPLTAGAETPPVTAEAAHGAAGTPVRAGTQGVPRGAQSRRPQRAARPAQLSLFGGPDSGGEIRAPDAPILEQPGGAGAPPPAADTGVTSPPIRSGGDSPARPDPPAVAGLKDAELKIAERSRSNYRITPNDHLGEGGPKAKVRANIDAIRVLKTIEDEAREATAGEKAILVKYTGWGAFSQAMFKDVALDWKPERDAFRALVTDDEYEAARASTLNAHFTSPEVISGMWQVLDGLGYKGGKALEPAAGIGHFIGLIPDKVAPKTAWTATELDPITGRIAKLLYGGADIGVHGFEELNRPPNYFDLAISNVPFGNFNLTEKPYGSFTIHDFFFVKSLDKVRPGGVVAFITSRYTMDRADGNTRRLLAQSADLVGAIRLPGGKRGAFASNAGTEVTTDILFLRKRGPGEAPLKDRTGTVPNWLETKPIETPEGPAHINEYFADRPHMMLGEMRLAATMYRKNEPALVPRDGEDSSTLMHRIAAAAAQQMSPAFTDRGTKAVLEPIEPSPVETLHGADVAAVKDGSFFTKDGALYQRIQGVGQPMQLSAADHDRVTRLAGMRDVYNNLIDAQLHPHEGSPADTHRAELRRAYDDFVKKYGPINKEVRTVTSRLDREGRPVVITRYPNLARFMDDPDAWKVASIENYDPETGKAKRADVQTKDVIALPTERQISGPADALAASLNDTGGIDFDHIARSLDLEDYDQVAGALGDLIYQNPNGRAWETADHYLSGDVVKKLEEARAIAADDTSYLRNVSALEKVQPTALVASEITAQFGAPWIPEQVYRDFFNEEFGAGNAKVKLIPKVGEWKISLSGLSRDAINKYGTNRVSAEDVAEAALNNRQIAVYDKKDDKRVFNAKASEEANIKAGLLKDAFAGDPDKGLDGWVFGDPDRSKLLEGIYNRTFNNLAPRKYDGSHLTLPGMNPKFTGRQHRKDAIWRVVQSGNALLAHVVGSGKTTTMIGSGMEQKRLGLINKPAYVIPNHMLEQFSREFIEAYPNAKILVAQKDEVSAANRAAFVAKAASNDWDGIILTHDAFGRINMDREWRRGFIRQQMDELDRIMQAEMAAGDAKDSTTVKRLEAAKKKLADRLLKLMAEERKDKGTSFEETGIDFLYVDEAHKFKNLAFITRLNRIKGLAQGDSQRAEDLFLKIRYLEQNRPGRSAVFATGTPVSNTMAELWTMQRYLQLARLRERGLDTFDAWAATFGRVQTNMALSADGRTLQPESSFSKFVNVPELIALYSEIADTKTADMLNLPRPEVVTRSGKPGIEIAESETSPAEEKFINALVELAAEIKGKPVVPGSPNMLSIATAGRKAAADGRLLGSTTTDKIAMGMAGVGPDDFEFNPRGKIALAINNIHRIWAEGKEPGLGQMVFLDMGTPKAKGAAPKATMEPTERNDGLWDLKEKGTERWLGGAFDTREAAEQYIADQIAPRMNLYDDIKKRLVDKGIPASQIAFIHDADNDAKKARLFQRVRSGDIRVILGSSEKMGVGTNAQDRLIAMHHIDAPWKPAEVEQRDGRIVRQGNLNDKVQIYRYVTKRSFDAFMWQKLDTKARFIAQVLSGARGSRTAEDIDNPLPEAAEMKAAASGDPRILEHAELDRQVRTLASQRRIFQQTQERAGYELGMARERIKQYDAALPGSREDAAKVTDLAGDNFRVELGGVPVTDRRAAGSAILQQVAAIDPQRLYSEKVLNVGKMSGFDMHMAVHNTWGSDGKMLQAQLSLKGKSGYANPNDVIINEASDPVSLMMRFERILRSIQQKPADLEARRAAESEGLDRLQQTMAKGWPKEAEYRDAVAKLDALSKAMAKPTHPDVASAKAEADREAAQIPTATDTQAFKRWFGDSKVVNKDGSPKVVYHATDADEDFHTFERTEDIGFHFGTEKAANDRLEQTRGKNEIRVERVEDGWAIVDAYGHRLVKEAYPNKEEAHDVVASRYTNWSNARVMPAYLSIKNPLRLPDLHMWDPADVLGHLEAKGIITPEESKSVQIVDYDFVAKSLAKKGYDGIVYRNLVEGQRTLGPEEQIDVIVRPNDKHMRGTSRAFIAGVEGDDHIGYGATATEARQNALKNMRRGRRQIGDDSYIVFRPEQIKSAIGNGGAFDPMSGNIAARRGAWGVQEPGNYGPGPGERVVQLSHHIQAFTRPFTAEEQKIADTVAEIGKRMAPQAEIMGASAVRFDKSPAWGAFIRSGNFHGLITWSLERAGHLEGEAARATAGARVAGTVRHEIIHHLRDAGLIRPHEWSALAEAAKDEGWLGKYDIPDRYPGLDEDHQIEEAVAEHFGAWRTDRALLGTIKSPLRRLVRQAFDRLDLFLRRVGAAVRGVLGKNATASDVFTRIETGEIGQRYSERIETHKRYLAAQANHEPIQEEAQTPGGEARERRERAVAAGLTPRTLRNRVVSLSDNLRSRGAAIATRIGADAIARDLQMWAAPMAAHDASVESRAIAKEFMNARRQSRQSWNTVDKYLTDHFSHAERENMWRAGDEESVARQQGRPTQGIGLDRLPADQRSVVETLQNRAQRNFADAKDLGMVEGEGLPAYTPRMVVRMAAEGGYERGIGPGAEVVKDIRTLALANARLEDAIASRRLINSIEEVGRRSGNPTVNTGAAPTRRVGAEGLVAHALDQAGRNINTKPSQLLHRKHLTTEETEAAARRAPPVDPDAPTWFTLNHPAFQVWRPKMVDAEWPEYRSTVRQISGMTPSKAMIPLHDEFGNPVWEKVPIYVRSDFEGPLRAVMSRDTNKVYRALMSLKGKAMSVIMFSPLIHNQVEWGRALPAAPGKVATMQIYLEGNRVANDPASMQRAIAGGVVPIGGHGFMQDIVSIAEEPTVRPGRSWTAKGLGYGAQALGYLTRLYDPRAGADEVRRSVDWFGNLWHNTLLWDRVRDLQMGLWGHIEQALVDKGHDPYAANVAAAHFANRYAGALPLEAMSGIARGIANVLLFSRTFTLGNLGAYKDALVGLPRDAQALIQQKLGWDELQKTQSYVKRKSRAMLAIDAGMYYATLSLLQSAFNVAGPGHTLGTLGGMILGGALGGRGGRYGRVALAIGGGAAGFGLAGVLGAGSGTRSLEDELDAYWHRFTDLVHRAGEHPGSVIGNPFKSALGLLSTAENEPEKTGRVLIGYDQDGTGTYLRLAPGKVTEELIGYLTEPNDMLHRKLSTFAKPLVQILENNIGFGRKAYDPQADSPASYAQNIFQIAGMLVEAQLPTDVASGAYQWARGGPGSGVAGLKTIAPVFGTTVSKGFPGGPELGVLYDAKERYEFRVQQALPGIRDQIRQGDVPGAEQRMAKLGIPPGLQKYYIQTTINPEARLTKRQMEDFMQYASPEERQRFFEAQQRTQRTPAHANGGAVNRAAGGRVELPEGVTIEQSDDSWAAFDVDGVMLGSAPLARAHGGRVEARNIDHQPSAGQKEAGNYAKDHLHWNGLPLTIENARGSVRRGVGKDGKPWACALPAHYGYIKRSEGADGDHVDVYLGPHPKAPKVYVVDQVEADTKKFDEHKVMLGFGSKFQAVACYKKGFSDGRGGDRIGSVTEMTLDQFKAWLERGDTGKPFDHVVGRKDRVREILERHGVGA